MNIRVYRIRKDAKLPERAHGADAGMDLFYCPDKEKSTYPPCLLGADGSYSLAPGASCLLSTGIKIEVPKDHMLEIKNKSGIAFKRQLLVGACVVDSGYDGEVFVNLHNIGTSTQTIEPAEKIAQAVLTPIVTCGIEEVGEDCLNEKSVRQAGGFGSTGLM
jgi:dUTP pyrophosphatase